MRIVFFRYTPTATPQLSLLSLVYRRFSQNIFPKYTVDISNAPCTIYILM